MSVERPTADEAIEPTAEPAETQVTEASLTEAQSRTAAASGTASGAPHSPWPALWAMVLGFFMILVDSTIVSVATPAIMVALDADVNAVVWVTSAYLLAYAVPLLITGRLGDRYGPKRVYLIGLTVFTLASLWCGLTDSIGALVVARVVQGLGASMLTPQTMAVITRTFPAASRGQAMALWGATAGVAMLVGPILGGVLTDGPGWEWIFFVNVPVGVVGIVLALRLVPRLETHAHSFDWLGVALSAVGMFLLVFGVQEGKTYDWGTIAGPLSIPALIITGLVVLGLFVWWQHRNHREPLLPLSLFHDRNFSLANAGISAVGCAFIAMAFPLMLYAQGVLGLSPTKAALLLAPMAVISGALAPIAGRLTDRLHPRWLASFGVVVTSGSFFWLALLMTPEAKTWQLLLPMALMGVGSPFLWGPLSATATRNLPMSAAGAGSGVYNATRQVGAVLGSAAIAVLMESRLVANLPGLPADGAAMQRAGGSMPPAIADGFASAMSESMLLPAAVLLAGVVAVLFFERPRHQVT